MEPLFAAGTALVVSLALIPVMTSLAPRLHLLDVPSARKVHAQPIPRVGGWGIAVGTMAAVLLWMPISSVSLAFVFGSIVLTVAGAADDMHELTGSLKLVLQFLATLPAIIYGGLAVDALPLGAVVNLPHLLGLSLTTLGLVVCINATNTSDGLDGLAAGTTLLSLFGLLYLGFASAASPVLLISAATLGGLIGFLRYNTHPAIIFMGDLGSQFLGFAVGFLGLALLTTGAGNVNPFALLLVFGLPVADILVVAVRRLIARRSIFKADKTHIHHRFLDLGLTHGQSVVLFYVLQGSFVFFGATFHDANTWKVLFIFFAHMALIYTALSRAERRLREGKFVIPGGRSTGGHDGLPRQLVLSVPRVTVEMLLPMTLIAGALLAADVPLDFGVLGLLLLLVFVARLMSAKMRTTALTRIAVFLLASAIVYLFTNHRPLDNFYAYSAELVVIGVLGIMAFVAVRFSPKRRKEEFHATSTDQLMVVFAVLAVIALRTIPSAFNPYYLMYLPIVLYCSELLVIERRQRMNWLPPSALVAAAILAFRGILLPAI